MPLTMSFAWSLVLPAPLAECDRVFVSLPVHLMQADGVRDNISQAQSWSCVLGIELQEVNWNWERRDRRDWNTSRDVSWRYLSCRDLENNVRDKFRVQILQHRFARQTRERCAQDPLLLRFKGRVRFDHRHARHVIMTPAFNLWRGPGFLTSSRYRKLKKLGFTGHAKGRWRSAKVRRWIPERRSIGQPQNTLHVNHITTKIFKQALLLYEYECWH